MTTNQQSYAKGMDVSHFQGKIDWAKVKASGITYAMAKATEGGTGQDALFLENFQGIKAQGMHAGAYHYYRALSSTPDEQLKNLQEMLTQGGFQADVDLLAIDVEITGNEQATPDQMADNLYSLLGKIRQTWSLSSYPYIYTSNNNWNKVNWRKYDFSVFPLWIAHWDATLPTVPDTWQAKGWRWWQTTAQGQVDGVAEAVDLDTVNEG